MALIVAPLKLIEVLSFTRQAPGHQLYTDYDEEADVLYVSFQDPPAIPANCIEDADGVITRYGQDGEVLGCTYMNASELLAQAHAA